MGGEERQSDGVETGGRLEGKPHSGATLFGVLGVVLFDILKNGVGSEEEKPVSHLPKWMFIQAKYLSALEKENRGRDATHKT